MASGIPRGRVRPTATESCNMAAIVQIMGWQRHGVLFTSLILHIHVMINWHLSKQGICWPVSRNHITGWPSAGFLIGSRAHVWLTCWKQGRIVQKPVNTSPGLKVNRIITFSSIQMFFFFFFVYMVIIETQNRRPNTIQETSAQSYKTQIKILLFPGLA